MHYLFICLFENFRPELDFHHFLLLPPILAIPWELPLKFMTSPLLSLHVYTYIHVGMYAHIHTYHLLRPFSAGLMYMCVRPIMRFSVGEDWFSLSRKPLLAFSTPSRSGAIYICMPVDVIQDRFKQPY